MAQLSILAIFAASVYLAKLEVFIAVFLLLLTPLVIFGGKLLLLAVDFLSEQATTNLILTRYQSIPQLAVYYALMVPLLVVLIENSIILSELTQVPQTWQISLAALSLAFLPRVISYASSIERARNTMITILTPLTLMALVLIAINPEKIVLSAEPFRLAFFGIPPLLVIGDSALYLSATIGVTKPPISIEMVAQSDIERNIRAQLVTYPYDALVAVLADAMRRKRRDTVHAIIESLSYALDLADKERVPRARASIARGITQSIPAHQNLTGILVPFIERLSHDEYPAAVKEISGSYEFLLEKAPDKCIHILESLAHHSDPRIRRIVVDFCWRRLTNAPSNLRGILVDSVEEYLRRIRYPLTNRKLKGFLALERRLQMESMAQPSFGTRVSPGLPGEESVFSQSDLLRLFHKAWDIDDRRMNSVVAEMAFSEHLFARYGAVMILTEQSLRDRIRDNKALIASLERDRSRFVRAVAKRLLGSETKNGISPEAIDDALVAGIGFSE